MNLKNTKLTVAVALTLSSSAALAQTADISVSTSFSYSDRQTIGLALFNIYANNHGFTLPSGETKFPYNDVINTISTINPVISGVTCSPVDGSGGCTYDGAPYKGPMWMFAVPGSLYQPLNMLALVHTGQHHVYGGHSCSLSGGYIRDCNDTGAYGVGAYYMAKLYWQSSNLDTYQRNAAQSYALYIADNNIADYSARSRIAGAALYNNFCLDESGQMYDESGQLTCINPMFNPPGPPPPADPPPGTVCYYDESGQICYFGGI